MQIYVQNALEKIIQSTPSCNLAQHLGFEKYWHIFPIYKMKREEENNTLALGVFFYIATAAYTAQNYFHRRTIACGENLMQAFYFLLI